MDRTGARSARRGNRDPPRDSVSRGDRGLDAVSRAATRAPFGRDRLDVASPLGVGHRRQRRGEAAAARARVRALGLPARGAQDRRAERALARRARRRWARPSRGFTASTCSCATARTETAPGTASPTTTGRRCARTSRRGSQPADPLLPSRCPVSGDGTGATDDRANQSHGRGRPRRFRGERAARRARHASWTATSRSSSSSASPIARSPRSPRDRRPGPWVAHVSGATPLAALDPHERRFGMHPLQSFSKSRGPEQLDGAWAAVTAETEEAQALGFWLAETLGLRPFALDDAEPRGVPRRRGGGLELPRHPAPGRRLAARGGRRSRRRPSTRSCEA